MSCLTVLSILLFGTFAPPSATTDPAEVPAFLTVIPGSTTKAEVDLTFGEAKRKATAEGEEFEYASPVGLDIFERIVISFHRDLKQVARLDAYFKAPHAAESIRTEMQLGNRVLSLDRSEGGFEEFYYPKLNALIFKSKGANASVMAVSYLSPRFLADVFVSRAKEFLRAQQYNDASDEADKAVVVDPDYARGYLAQGWYYQSQKNYDEALVRFLAAANARYSPQSKGQAHAELGLVYWNQKNLPDKAQAEFQQGIAVAPDYYYTHLHYGRFLHARKQEEMAQSELMRAVELDPKRPDTLLELASFLRDKKDYTSAIPHYQWLSQWAESEAAANRDDNFKSRIHFDYAYSLASGGKDAQAMEAYQLALKRNPRYVSALNNIGVLYQRLKDPAKAEEYYRTGLKVEPKHFLLNRNLAKALLERGQTEDACRQAEYALSLKPDDSYTMIDIAHCWAAREKKKQTLEWLEKAIAAGFRDTNQLANDRYFDKMRSNADFKKLLQQMR